MELPADFLSLGRGYVRESQRAKKTCSSGARQLRLQSITAQGRPRSPGTKSLKSTKQ